MRLITVQVAKAAKFKPDISDKDNAMLLMNCVYLRNTALRTKELAFTILFQKVKTFIWLKMVQRSSRITIFDFGIKSQPFGL